MNLYLTNKLPSNYLSGFEVTLKSPQMDFVSNYYFNIICKLQTVTCCLLFFIFKMISPINTIRDNPCPIHNIRYAKWRLSSLSGWGSDFPWWREANIFKLFHLSMYNISVNHLLSNPASNILSNILWNTTVNGEFRGIKWRKGRESNHSVNK